MSDKPKPSAPASFNGIRSPFQGTIHLSFLDSIGSGTQVGIPYHGRYDWTLGGFDLDPGIYWIVATGSMWGYCDGRVMHTDRSHDDTVWSWDSGTRDMGHPLHDTQWHDYIMQHPVYPFSLQIFWT